MKPVYMIGDCHTSRISEHWDPNNCNFEIKFWGKAGENAWNFNPKELKILNQKSSGVELPAIHVKDKLITKWRDIKDDGLILAWLGYVDSRQYLSKYNNAEECAKKYIDSLIEYFPNSIIQIIEPLPQFVELNEKYKNQIEPYSYEERSKQNFIFCETLNKYAKEKNINKPITQQEIKNAVGIEEFTNDYVPTDRLHPTDTLKREYIKKIYDLFILKSYKILNNL